MNKYKPHLDVLILKLSLYIFSVKKIETLLSKDAEQLRNGGDFYNLSSIYIRDWGNFSSSNWLIDYKRVSFFGKDEYLQEVNKIESKIYSHYLLETYERMLDFIWEILGKDRRKATIETAIKNIDSNFQDRKTPFGFNIITFMFVFGKIRNAITHNEGLMDIKADFTNYSYLKEFDINKAKCDAFINNYFQIQVEDQEDERIIVSKESLKDMVKFTQSFCFELFKFYSVKDNLDWEIKNITERLDIKTSLPLTESQKAYLKSTSERSNGKD